MGLILRKYFNLISYQQRSYYLILPLFLKAVDMTFIKSDNNLGNGVFSFDCSDFTLIILYGHLSGMFERLTIKNILYSVAIFK
jgi:hypothetical protein